MPLKVEVTEDHGLAIVVLDRGFVYIGHVVTDGRWVTITDAQNIRVWGTTKGLGELALEGPKKETKLDKVGTVRAAHRALISIIETKEALWKCAC